MNQLQLNGFPYVDYLKVMNAWNLEERAPPSIHLLIFLLLFFIRGKWWIMNTIRRKHFLLFQVWRSFIILMWNWRAFHWRFWWWNCCYFQRLIDIIDLNCKEKWTPSFCSVCCFLPLLIDYLLGVQLIIKVVNFENQNEKTSKHSRRLPKTNPAVVRQFYIHSMYKSVNNLLYFGTITKKILIRYIY